MKQIITAFVAISILLTGCATVQSIVRSSFPYTATLIIPSSSNVNSTLSARSSATSFDQIFTGKTTSNENIKEVRISSAKITASSPANQNLAVFRSIRVFISQGDGSSEVLVANRTDISPNAGNSLVLDIDNSKFLDAYLKSSSVRVRMEYTLKERLNVDLSVKASLGFSVSPGTTN